MAEASRPAVAARLLLAACGGFWIARGSGAATVWWPRLSGATPLAPALVVLMFVNAAVLLGLSYALRRPTRVNLAAAAGWTALNLVLSFTDEIGLLDLASAGLSLGALGMVVAAWRGA